MGFWASGGLSNLVRTVSSVALFSPTAHEISLHLLYKRGLFKPNLFFQRWILVLVTLKSRIGLESFQSWIRYDEGLDLINCIPCEKHCKTGPWVSGIDNFRPKMVETHRNNWET